MPHLPIQDTPAANEPDRISSARLRFERRLRARLRGAPMSAFRSGGPGGRFLLVRDREGRAGPVLLLSASPSERVADGEVVAATAEMGDPELIGGLWRRRAHTVTLQADQGGLDPRDVKGALGRGVSQYRVLLLQAAAA